MQLITESEIKESTFKSFVGKENDISESIYFLVDEDCFSEVVSLPLIMAHGVMAANELESIESLREHQGMNHRICYINSKDLKVGDLQPLTKQHEHWRESMADSGFCRLELTNPAAKIHEITASSTDEGEIVQDLAAYWFGEGKWKAKLAQETSDLLIWTCINESEKAPVFIASSFRGTVFPFSALPAGSSETMVNEQIALAKEFGYRSSMEDFEDRLRNAVLPVSEDFAFPSTGILTETLRPKMAASLRLKKLVTDLLTRDPEMTGQVKEVLVSGDKLTAKVGRRTYIFDIERDPSGWITNIKFVWPKHRKQETLDIEKKINKAFSDAQFAQVLVDACSEDVPKLVMLDYIRIDNNGRKTRLVEPYSYRTKSSTGRTYFYGWNVEEGGIRSYITDRIQGARKTDQVFKPRFLIEIGAAVRSKKKVKYKITKDTPATVSKAVIARAHERFDLKGGYGKIIKALGRSVDTPYAQKQKRDSKKYEKAKELLAKTVEKNRPKAVRR
jgi:hypothetical protein